MAVNQARNLAGELLKVSTAWPKDPFRPNLQLPVFLESLAKHPRLTPASVKASEALLNNAIRAKYPTPETLLRPKSMPLHYDRLLEGYEKSAQGIKRPWYKVFFNIW